jgi:drug/metabolite transporter (DMT)-like permease
VTLQEFGLLLISVFLSVVGQVLLKFGALKLGKVTAGNLIGHLMGIITIPELLLGLFFYGLGAMAYILLLTRVKLSVVGPSSSFIYIFSVLLGYFIFKEAIPIQRLFGLGLIVCGVVLVVWQK